MPGPAIAAVEETRQEYHAPTPSREHLADQEDRARGAHGGRVRPRPLDRAGRVRFDLERTAATLRGAPPRPGLPGCERAVGAGRVSDEVRRRGQQRLQRARHVLVLHDREDDRQRRPGAPRGGSRPARAAPAGLCAESQSTVRPRSSVSRSRRPGHRTVVSRGRDGVGVRLHARLAELLEQAHRHDGVLRPGGVRAARVAGGRSGERACRDRSTAMPPSRPATSTRTPSPARHHHRAALAARPGDHLHRLRLRLADDDAHARLDHAGLLGGDGRERVAEEALVIEVDRGDGRGARAWRRWSRRTVRPGRPRARRTSTPARRKISNAAAVVTSKNVGSVAQRAGAAQATRRPAARAATASTIAGGADRLPVDREAFLEADEVRRRVEARADARRRAGRPRPSPTPSPCRWCRRR